MKNLELTDRIEIKEIFEEYTKNIGLMKQGNPWYAGPNNYKQVSLRVPFTFAKDPTIYKRDYKRRTQSIMRNRIETKDTDYVQEYPVLMATLTHLAAQYGGYLSRASVVSTHSELKEYPHIDCGYFYPLHDRYHLVIFSSGSYMSSGQCSQTFVTGDVFYINNTIVHYGKHSEEGKERIHVLFDILPKSLPRIVQMYCRWLFIDVRIKGYYNYSLWKRLLGASSLFRAIGLSHKLFTNSHNSDT